MIPVFTWERAVQGWVVRESTRLVGLIRVANIALAGEEVMTTAAPGLTLAVLLTAGLPVAVLFLAAFLSARHVEAWAKGLAHRGRPRDEAENGLPSGDCAIITIWASVLLGWWAVLPIAFVMWARMALGAHWPLDTVIGVVMGLALIAPALVMR